MSLFTSSSTAVQEKYPGATLQPEKLMLYQAVRQSVFPFGGNFHLTLCLTSLALSPPHSFNPAAGHGPKFSTAKIPFVWQLFFIAIA